MSNATTKTVLGQKPATVVSWAVQGDLQKTETESLCRIQNSKGAFVLRKNAQGHWQLDRASPDQTLPANMNIASIPYVAVSLSGDRLTSLEKDPAYEFSDWRQVGETISCTVTNNSAGPMKKFDSAELVLDMQWHCRLKSVSLERELPAGPDTVRKTDVFDYEYGLDPYLPAKLTAVYTLHSSTPQATKETREFTKISHTPLPESEFSLAHYGLSDLNDKEASPRPLLLVLGMCFLAVLVVVFGIRYLRK